MSRASASARADHADDGDRQPRRRPAAADRQGRPSGPQRPTVRGDRQGGDGRPSGATVRPDRQARPSGPDRQGGAGDGDRQPRPLAADRPRWASVAGADEHGSEGSTTHRVVVPPHAAEAEEGPGTELERWSDGTVEPGPEEGRVLGAIATMRFASTTPLSLPERLEYARSGLYSDRKTGAWRTANILFARLIATPTAIALCYLTFAFTERLDRAMRHGFCWMLLFTLLNFLPATAWLTPDGLDVTAMFRGADPAPVVEPPAVEPAPAPAGVG